MITLSERCLSQWEIDLDNCWEVRSVRHVTYYNSFCLSATCYHCLFELHWTIGFVLVSYGIGILKSIIYYSWQQKSSIISVFYKNKQTNRKQLWALPWMIQMNILVSSVSWFNVGGWFRLWACLHCQQNVTAAAPFFACYMSNTCIVSLGSFLAPNPFLFLFLRLWNKLLQWDFLRICEAHFSLLKHTYSSGTKN